MKRIGIIGSRRRNSDTDFMRVSDLFFTVYKENDIIISGGCPKGGDRFAEIIADKYNITKVIFRPNWRLGRHAGFLRNTTIAQNSDILIACVAPNRKGGTEDTIKKFKKFYPSGEIYLIHGCD